MSKYRVHFTAGASIAITVELDDADMDADEAREAAIEEAYQSLPPGLCAHCSGWGNYWSQDIGQYEVEQGDDAVEWIEATP